LKAINHVDWNCEIQILQNSQNLGLAKSIVRAIDWVFESEEIAIIIEDDILINNEFCYLVENLMISKQIPDHIQAVCAANLLGQACSHTFRRSEFMHSWGWATNKFQWQLFSRSLKNEDYLPSIWQLVKRLHFNPRTIVFFAVVIRKLRKGLTNSWAYPFFLHSIKQKNFFYVSNQNLAINIGHDTDGTNTKFYESYVKTDFESSNFDYSECSLGEAKTADREIARSNFNFNMKSIRIYFSSRLY
jgi:hypothetical protein